MQFTTILYQLTSLMALTAANPITPASTTLQARHDCSHCDVAFAVYQEIYPKAAPGQNECSTADFEAGVS